MSLPGNVVTNLFVKFLAVVRCPGQWTNGAAVVAFPDRHGHAKIRPAGEPAGTDLRLPAFGRNTPAGSASETDFGSDTDHAGLPHVAGVEAQQFCVARHRGIVLLVRDVGGEDAKVDRSTSHAAPVEVQIDEVAGQGCLTLIA